MRELHQAISNTYGHKMSVTGASYMGVSVPDCIKNSRLLVEDLMVSGALGSQQKVVTGLDKVNDLNDSHRISKGNTDVILNTK
jgi:oxygen-dependent protoporphyrinogen oxidase